LGLLCAFVKSQKNGHGFLGQLALVRRQDTPFNPRILKLIGAYCDHVHSKRWIVDRATLKQARVDDLQYVDDPQYLDLLNIFFANGESILIKQFLLNLRAD
jgi:hypothetical protein